jgi:hypothetical protein
MLQVLHLTNDTSHTLCNCTDSTMADEQGAWEQTNFVHA